MSHFRIICLILRNSVLAKKILRLWALKILSYSTYICIWYNNIGKKNLGWWFQFFCESTWDWFFPNLTLKYLVGAKNRQKIANNYFEAILSTSPSLWLPSTDVYPCSNVHSLSTLRKKVCHKTSLVPPHVAETLRYRVIFST